MPLPQHQQVLEGCLTGDVDFLSESFPTILRGALDEDATVRADALALLRGLELDEASTTTNDVLVDSLWMVSCCCCCNTTTTAAPAAPAKSTDGKKDDTDNNNQDKRKELTSRCAAAVHALVAEYPCLTDKLVATLDAALLEAAQVGMIRSPADLQKRLRQHNTLLYYRQYKFNLLSEESQGYSKLLQLLSNCRDNSSSSTNVTNNTNPAAASDDTSDNDKNKDMLLRLIGEFSLDPNRCLDLVLELLQLNENNNSFSSAQKRLLALIPVLPVENLPKLLGFTLSNNMNNKNISGKNGKSSASSASLLRCMAHLVGADLLDITEMLSFLPPWREMAEALYQKIMKQEKERVKSSTRVRLSSSSSADKQIPPVDISELKGCLAIQWLIILLAKQPKHLLNGSLTADEWSQLCVIMPTTIGTGLCDWVASRLAPWDASQSRPPWTTNGGGSDANKSDNDNAMDTAPDGNQSPPLSDLLDALEPLEYTLTSGCLALSPCLVTSICRILASYTAVDIQKERRCLHLLSNVMLPILGSAELASPALSGEVWKTIGKLPYPKRFSLYTTWRGSGLEKAALNSTKPQWQIAAEIQAGKDARYQLKRLSKDTIRDASRGTAKVCHGHPLVVFSTILNQIESYDNLVEVMVDALRFVTPLSLDVLGFCILSRLNGTTGGLMVNRSRLKPDGVNVSQWLQSLESFTGYFYKRFPNMELGGILEYLVGRLKQGHVMELGMLRTLLSTAGGWAFCDFSPAASLSDAQLQGRSGSVRLKRETMSFGVIQKYNPRASTSIRSVLQQDDVGISLLVMISQVRYHILFENSDPLAGNSKPVKLIGNLLDTCQVISSILLDFLASDPLEGGQEGHSMAKLGGSMPSLEELCSDFGMEAPTAWMVCRPLLRAVVLETVEVSKFKRFQLGEPARVAYKKLMPVNVWEHMSENLYEIFFTYSLYDMVCPEAIYKGEVSRLEKELDRLKNLDSRPPVGVQPGAAPESTPEEEAVRCKKTIASLNADRSEQGVHVEYVRKSIQESMHSLFCSKDVTKEAAEAFLTHCIFPRCMQSPDDALYCAHFIGLLHDIETPGFGTVLFFDAAIVSMSRALYSVTEGEAANISIFLVDLWKIARKWRYEEKDFAAELAGKPGASVGSGPAVTYKSFETWYNKWHAAVGAVAIGCLKSKEYIHLRNCLIVLTRLVDFFPTRPKLANGILKTLEPLQEESNPLADIRASAQAYGMQLIKARDDGAWKEEDAATVRARQAKEKEAEASRTAKAKEAMAEIEREAGKITERIGDGRNGASRGRGNLGNNNNNNSSNGGSSGNGGGGMIGNNDRPRSRSPDRGGRSGRRNDDRRPPRRDDGRGRRDESRGPPRAESNRRGMEGRFETADDRNANGKSNSNNGSNNASNINASSSNNNNNNKRSRDPSPEPGEESRNNNKRSRPDDRPRGNNSRRRNWRS